ncbi:MAG: calcium/sodium antiporter [Gammaproteobacteria bacterium]
MSFITMVLGLVFAILGAKLLISGGVSIAKRFNIPDLIIGSTIIAMGTSMPEVSVNVQSALAGNTDLALGNIIGSNIFNICMIIGVVALVTPLAIPVNAASKDFPMCLIAAIVVGVAGNELYFDGINYHEIMPSHGIIFLAFFYLFAHYTYEEAVEAHTGFRPARPSKELSDEILPTWRSLLYIVIGLVGLIFGGDFIVEGATGIAERFGLSERVIGLLIVGPGTSFPELIAGIVAALNRKVDMVIGNVLGSNIINIFFTLGITSLILPVPLDLELNTAVVFNIVVTALLVAFAWLGRARRPIGRRLGAILVLAYVLYILNSLGMVGL